MGAAVATLDYEIATFLAARRLDGPVEHLEMLEPVFYRATRAFLVGRMSGADWSLPLVGAPGTRTTACCC